MPGLSPPLPGRFQAHAPLVRSDPVVDAKLAEPPAVVTAWFSESLDSSLSTMPVLNGTGTRVDIDAVTFSDQDRTMMRQGLQDGLQPGFYVVVWETLSAVDGHFIKGSFPFTVLNADGSEPSGPRPEVAGTSGGEPAPDKGITKPGGLVGAATPGAWGPAAAVRAVAGVAELLVQARQPGGLDLADKVVSDTEWGQRWV